MVSVDVKHHVYFTSCNLSGKSKTRMTASVLKQDPNTFKKKIYIYIKKKGGGWGGGGGGGGRQKERYLLKFKYCFAA